MEDPNPERRDKDKSKKKKRPHSAPLPPPSHLGSEGNAGPDARSFCRGNLPRKKMVEKIREVVAPHVESFNYFLEEVSGGWRAGNDDDDDDDHLLNGVVLVLAPPSTSPFAITIIASSITHIVICHRRHYH